MHVLQLHDRNAQLILSVPSTSHAFKKSAKILASQQHVVLMPNAVPTTTELCAFVKLAMSEIPILSVKNVRIFEIIY